MTKIAVNTRLLRKGRLEGIGWFTWESFKRITADHPEVEFHFFFDAKPDPEFIPSSNVKAHVLWPPARRVWLFQLWFDFSVTRKLKQIKPDLFVSPDGYASLTTDVPQLVVMHDLNFIHHPEWLPKNVAKWLNKMFPQFAQKATRIATVSEYSAQDICKSFEVAREEVDVVYNGVNQGYAPVSADEKKSTQKRYADGFEYLVFVGSMHARKNVERMLLAFDQMKSKSNSEVKMVLVGAPMWSGSSIAQTVEQLEHKRDILFVGRKELVELQAIVAGAEAMVFVPLFEGFGIPALEAMASGVPLIASNTTSLPEIVGDAAIQVHPEDINAISEAMVKVVQDEELRTQLVQKGFERAKLYSWDRTSQKLWTSMQRTISKST